MIFIIGLLIFKMSFNLCIICPKYKFGNIMEQIIKTNPFTTPVTYPYFTVFLPIFNKIPKYAKESINNP